MKRGLALAILLAGGVLLWSGCQKAETHTLPPAVVRVLKVVPTITGSGEERTFSGVVQPYRRVDLAFRVGGYVASIRQARGSDGRMRALEPGDSIARGALLVTLRRTDYRARVDQGDGAVAESEAARRQAAEQLRQSTAQLAQATLDWERAQNLFRAAALTKPEYDAAEARFRSLEAQAQAARQTIALETARGTEAAAQRDAAQVSLNDTQLISPLDGVVLNRAVEVGSLAASGTEALSVAEIATVKTVFGIADVDLRQVQLGARLPVHTDAFPGQTFSGTVTSIAPAADDRSRTYNVQLTLPNAKLQLKPGMIVSIALGRMETTQPALVLPMSALVRAGTGRDSFAVCRLTASNGKYFVHRQAVSLGATSGSGVAIAGGLSEGDLVVESGGSQLLEGQQVSVAPGEN